MTELIQMAPLIKNEFYLLDACLLSIPATACVNSRGVNVRVREAVSGDTCRQVEACFVLLAIPFEWVTCVVRGKKQKEHTCMCLYARVCKCLHGLISHIV